MRIDMVLIIRSHMALKTCKLFSFFSHSHDLGVLAQSLNFCCKKGSVKDDLFSQKSTEIKSNQIQLMLMTARLFLLKSNPQVRFILRLRFAPCAFF